MTDLSADERAERIIRSLKTNSAEFLRQEQLSRSAHVRMWLWHALYAAGGILVGGLLVAWLR